MEIEDEDDFYSPEEPIVAPTKDTDTSTTKHQPATTTTSRHDDELEEGEEEDEGGVIIEEDEDDSVSPYFTLRDPLVKLPANSLARMSTSS